MGRRREGNAGQNDNLGVEREMDMGKETDHPQDSHLRVPDHKSSAFCEGLVPACEEQHLVPIQAIHISNTREVREGGGN